jgi:hypothetical protein
MGIAGIAVTGVWTAPLRLAACAPFGPIYIYAFTVTRPWTAPLG